MKTNELLLLLKIQNAGLDLQSFLEKLNLGIQSYKLRIKGKRDFKQKEIKQIIDLLELTPEEVIKIFFE